MTPKEQDSFSAAFHVRRVERCCGTCRHFDRQYEDSGCAHPRQAEFDSWERTKRNLPDHIPETYGAYGGVYVDEGHVCDLWEEKEKVAQ